MAQQKATAGTNTPQKSLGPDVAIEDLQQPSGVATARAATDDRATASQPFGASKPFSPAWDDAYNDDRQPDYDFVNVQTPAAPSDCGLLSARASTVDLKVPADNDDQAIDDPAITAARRTSIDCKASWMRKRGDLVGDDYRDAGSAVGLPRLAQRISLIDLESMGANRPVLQLRYEARAADIVVQSLKQRIWAVDAEAERQRNALQARLDMARADRELKNCIAESRAGYPEYGSCGE
ncbi:hypothetical protein LTR53_014938 [Teratosphaeriaceae sp. CCFEE 6253]|nr:hypothetical protein LTR53_014938 [Teratosphaeriaceae sp. CCFEE 6253]